MVLSNVVNGPYEVFHVVTPSHRQLSSLGVRQVCTACCKPGVVYRVTKLGDIALQQRVKDVLIQQLLGDDVIRSRVLEQRLRPE